MTNRLRMVSLALFGSLIVNLFLGGLMLGRWFDPHPSRHRAERSTTEGGAPGWMHRALGPEGAPALEEAWEAHAAEIAPLREAMRRSREAVTATLEAEPFDRQAYAAALAEMRDGMDRFYTAINDVMIDVVSQLTPDQRRAVVERSREWERRKAGRDAANR